MMGLMTYLDGSKLKRLRIGRGFSQRELAQKAQMSPSTIVLLEKKTRNEGFTLLQSASCQKPLVWTLTTSSKTEPCHVSH